MPRSDLRTVFLQERTTTACRLSPADVAFLLAEHLAHVTLFPTDRRHHYRLTPGPHVGTIICPESRLVIRPKIPLTNLFTLLDPAAPLAIVEDRSEAIPGTEALTFLAARLAQMLTEQAAAGLHRGYAERTHEGPFLQGRLDVASHVRAPAGRKDRLHCRFEDFTTDVPCNQVPRATADLVLRSPLLTENARAALHRALEAYAEVSLVALRPESFTAALPDGGTPQARAAYRPLLDTCRLLAEGLAPRAAAGAVSSPAFLLDMERVFERYVTRAVLAEFAGTAGYHVAVQPSFTPAPAVAGQPTLSMRPDLVIDRAGSPWLVMDAKWKDLEDATLIPADTYQVLAYAAALGLGRSALVYPGRHYRAWDYPLSQGAVRLMVYTVRVRGSAEGCARSLRKMGKSLR